MVKTIVFRGSTGVTAFVLLEHKRHEQSWRCVRDTAELSAPKDATEIVQFLQLISAHAATHVGTIAQIVELTV